MNPDKRADVGIGPYRVRRKITGGAGGGLAAFNGTSGETGQKGADNVRSFLYLYTSAFPRASGSASRSTNTPPSAESSNSPPRRLAISCMLRQP